MNEKTIKYQGRVFSLQEMERQFNPRAMVPGVDALLEARAAQSAEFRDRMRGARLGVSYGDGEREICDVFPAAKPGAPVLVFFHGGYWRGGHARDYSATAEPFVDAGATVFIATYDLCPTVPLAHIIGQSRNAIAWVWRNASRFNGDPDRLFVSGHSAGAHLSAMALANDWTAHSGMPTGPIKGACLVSGIFDLAPVLEISLNEEIRAKTDDVAPLSPLNHAPRYPLPVIVGVGLAESEEWVRQSHLYTETAENAGCQVELIEVPAAHHFSILFDMQQAANPITIRLCDMMLG